MKKYQITLNEEQLLEIMNALETVGRASIGQFDKIMQYPINSENKRGLFDHSLTEEIETKVKEKMGLEKNQSYGVGQNAKVDSVFDMYEVIRHKIYWDRAIEQKYTDGTTRNWDKMQGVMYDKPFHWNKSVGLIKVEEVK